MMQDLAPYAAKDETSRGRVYAEPAPHHRGQYQRDRDRIIHSAAFRRLEYKTQVFVNHEGDMFRTRLTHSIEVAQIGRTIARALSLNEDLTEAICLAHDLGHTPFGHAGQDRLNMCMKDYGGFEHNLQSLRVVEVLEEKYAEFPGLNLMYETREGILKHCSPTKASELGELGRRFLEGGQPGLEAQVANMADEIAYNNHDVDDGLRAGLINMDQLSACRLFDMQRRNVVDTWPDLAEKPMTHEIIRRMINYLVSDLVRTSRANINIHKPETIEMVRKIDVPLICFSDVVHDLQIELKRFLRVNLYQHDRVKLMTDRAKETIQTLYDAYMQDTGLLPPDTCARSARSHEHAGIGGRARVIADYIAGMTDRFAITEYDRIRQI
jgi:dGTPase